MYIYIYIYTQNLYWEYIICNMFHTYYINIHIKHITYNVFSINFGTNSLISCWDPCIVICVCNCGLVSSFTSTSICFISFKPLFSQAWLGLLCLLRECLAFSLRIICFCHYFARSEVYFVKYWCSYSSFLVINIHVVFFLSLHTLVCLCIWCIFLWVSRKSTTALVVLYFSICSLFPLD